ncbi:MAG: arabinose isomerase [Deinococcus-Thermus bacterium]|jgi:L-arabinose isomerase|nr:arabinose isomerase [Deinococcota bacterium]
MQPLYDAMLPRITERQAAFALAVAERLSPTFDLEVAAPAKGREEVEARLAEFRRADVDGVIVVMLTYGPSLRTAGALADASVPVLLANVQPERSVRRDWTMADLTYNQGVHGAQDLANVLTRYGAAFDVVTEDWQAPGFQEAVTDWAYAAAAATAWRRSSVARIGHAMEGTGDVRFDEVALGRDGPRIEPYAVGVLARKMRAVAIADVERVMRRQESAWSVDPALAADAREEAARAYLALGTLLERGGHDAYTLHFGAVADDGRFGRLPLVAASALLEQGYGYAAEGDVATAALVAVGQRLAGPAHFTEMYAMDFDTDAVLLSHMGEGNPALARDDEPVRLADRELGIGGLGRPPTTVFRIRPGPVTLASLAPIGRDAFRLVLAEGEILDDAPMPSVEMPYGTFRPDGGVRSCLDAWLRAGGTHHQCLLPGRQAGRWRRFAAMIGVEVASTTG